MINKRLLIRNLLSHNDENSFYDKKLKLNLVNKEGKAKFLKHICALSNSNPLNNAYIVVGIDDASSGIVGVDFFDDSRIQNLVNACLENPPIIKYENISFPSLPHHKVVGLVTVFPSDTITAFKKNYWKYTQGMVFFREGSISLPTATGFILKSNNKVLVDDLEKKSSDNLELTLNGVVDFLQQHSKKYKPKYLVYKEYFVLCWAGLKKKVNNETYYSRVDIELVREQVRLFYSSSDEVQIIWDESSFTITEYVLLGIHKNFEYYPLEQTRILFTDNAKYSIESTFLFQAPKFDFSLLKIQYEKDLAILQKIISNEELQKSEMNYLVQIPTNFLICSFNGFQNIKELLLQLSEKLRDFEDKVPYVKCKEALRILRKVKYQM